MKKKKILILLERLRNKGGAWQSQYVAIQLLKELKKILPDRDYYLLCIAHSHYTIGEGAGELYESCNHLIKKYSG